MRIECPHCKTSYTTERCGIVPKAGTVFTVICTLCGDAFDGNVTLVEGIAASAAHRLTGGWLGTPATDHELTITTQKRS